MVKIIVDKDSLTKMIDMWIRFTIVEDKPRREIPKEWDKYLLQLNERWNKQTKIWWKKWLPKNKNIAQTHQDARNKLYWSLYSPKYENPVNEVLKLVKLWLFNYLKDIKEREDNDWYWKHRFKLYQFLSQKNWLRNFI